MERRILKNNTPTHFCETGNIIEEVRKQTNTLSMVVSLRYDAIKLCCIIFTCVKRTICILIYPWCANHNVLRPGRPRRQPLFERENKPVQDSVRAHRSCSSRFVRLSFFPSFRHSLTTCHRTILTTSFVFLWKTIQRCTRSVSLALIGLYPITGAIYLFLVMPLATRFAFPDDLPPGVNPLKPKDYVFLIKKTWFAMKRDNFKVEGKDL